MYYTNKSIVQCHSGDVLASDIYSTDGNSLILSKGSILNEYIMQRLLDMGIKTVRVCQCAEEIPSRYKEVQEKYRQMVSLTKGIFQAIVAGKTLNYNDLSYVADQIQSSIQDDGNIIRCISEIYKVDEYTYYHSINVAFYSMLIASWLKLPKAGIRKAVVAGLLHDIGKIRIPDELLNKKGKLTQEEIEILRSHPVHGYEIADGVDLIDQDIKAAILHHHERLDGSGYPFHYHDRNINLYSRIVAVADVFDAMTSERVYKERNTPFEVFEMFTLEGPAIFDLSILNLFMRKMTNYLIGSRVQLSNGETGDVVYVPYQCMESPIIQVADRYIDLADDDNSVKIIRML